MSIVMLLNRFGSRISKELKSSRTLCECESLSVADVGCFIMEVPLPLNWFRFPLVPSCSGDSEKVRSVVPMSLSFTGLWFMIVIPSNGPSITRA